MINKFYSFFFSGLLVLGLFACDTEDLDIQDESIPACQITSFNTGEGFAITFTYENNRLVKFEAPYSYQDCSIDEFGNEECFTTSGIDIIEYSYNTDGTVSLVTYYELEKGQVNPTDTDVINMVYAGGRLVKMAEQDGSYEVRLSYDNTNHMTKIEGVSNNIVYNVEEIVWSGDNVASVKGYYNDFSGNRKDLKLLEKAFVKRSNRHSNRTNSMVLSSELTFSNYDDKNNPFYGNIVFYVLYFDYAGFLGKNNPQLYGEKYFYNNEPESWVNTLQYTYNAQGYPISYRFQNDTENFTLGLEYACK